MNLGISGILLIVSLIVANALVTVAVARSHYYGGCQKAIQVLLVWIFPLLGAVAVGVFLYSQRDNPMFNTRAYSEPNEEATSYPIHETVQGHDDAP